MPPRQTLLRPLHIGTALGLALLLVSLLQPAAATSLIPKTDNSVIAVDLQSGRILWRHTPAKLGYAHFELFKRALVVFPHYAQSDRSGAYALHPTTGKVLKRKAARAARKQMLLARSETFWPLGDLRLANGWRVDGLNPGNTKSMHFVDPATKRITGRLDTGLYYDQVEVHKNLVLYADSYLAKTTKVFAYDAKAAKAAWSVDLANWMSETDEWARRKKLQVIADTLYVQARQHIFAFEAATGKLHWHRDLSADIGLSFHADIVNKGGYAMAVFARDRNTLVISYCGRVIAFDEKQKRYLWHMKPDSQATPFPVAHGGRVYLIAGKNPVVKKAP